MGLSPKIEIEEIKWLDYKDVKKKKNVYQK
jgi:hypothetical protein